MEFLADKMSPLSKIRNSAAFRISPCFRYILDQIPGPALQAKPLCPLTMITMCGAKHLGLLRETLYSIALAWRCLPPVNLIIDETVDQATVYRELQCWPAPLTVLPWQLFRDEARDRGWRELADYADKDSYGRKMAAILVVSARATAFWCDADILFYRDFSEELLKPIDGDFFHSTSDVGFGYDPILTAELPYLLEYEPVNTGIVLCRGEFFERFKLGPLIEKALPTCSGITEQTILAHLLWQCGSIRWQQDSIQIPHEDPPRIFSGHVPSHVLARHYFSGVRRMFWRDALGLRLFDQRDV